MAQVEIASRRCPKCSASAFANARFCSECGTALGGGGAQPERLEIVRHYVVDVAAEAGELARSALKSDLGKKVAGGAALGAAAAAVVPFVGFATGAVLGAVLVSYKELTK